LAENAVGDGKGLQDGLVTARGRHSIHYCSMTSTALGTTPRNKFAKQMR
jgi:hypothetical protein